MRSLAKGCKKLFKSNENIGNTNSKRCARRGFNWESGFGFFFQKFSSILVMLGESRQSSIPSSPSTSISHTSASPPTLFFCHPRSRRRVALHRNSDISAIELKSAGLGPLTLFFRIIMRVLGVQRFARSITFKHLQSW